MNPFIKTISIILIPIILLQGCTLYSKTPVSIDQAIFGDIRKAKVITYEGKELYFDSLYYKGNEIYGMLSMTTKTMFYENIKYQNIEIKINKESVKEVYLYDTQISKNGTKNAAIAIPLIFIGGLLIVWICISNSIGLADPYK